MMSRWNEHENEAVLEQDSVFCHKNAKFINYTVTLMLRLVVARSYGSGMEEVRDICVYF